MLSGKFRVERLLGVGGMGVVLEATHLHLRERVALKFLLPHAVKDEAAVARFEREARAAARLKSEHVVRVMDVGTLDDGAPYMVMELLQGKDLATVMREMGPLPVPLALEYLQQLCTAVGDAHAKGIVHRDLKPENVFITQKMSGDPLLKVLDFGISKMTDDLSLTKTTQVMGSPYYMAPEQLRASKDVDQRSDIWSMGAIIYEMMTGRLPFEATTLMELCTRVLEVTPPPLAEFRTDTLPPELQIVVDRCLAKRREDRYSNVREIVADLNLPTRNTGPSFESLSRISLGAVKSAAKPNTSARVLPPDASPSARRISGATNTSWNHNTQDDAGKSRKRQIAIGIGLGSIGLVLVGAVLAPLIENSHSVAAPPSPTASPQPSAAVTVTAAAVAPSAIAQPSTQPSATPLASVAPSASAAAIAPTATTFVGPSHPAAQHDAAPAVTASAAPTATVAPTATTTKPDDDLPNVR